MNFFKALSIVVVFFVEVSVRAQTLDQALQSPPAQNAPAEPSTQSTAPTQTAQPESNGSGTVSTTATPALTPPTSLVTDTAATEMEPATPISDSDVQSIMESPGTGKVENLNLEKVKINIRTNLGTMTFKMFGKEAPNNVENFLSLALGKKVFVNAEGRRLRQPFYDDLQFFKVLPGFIIQAGCPRNDGTGGPGFIIKDELNDYINLSKPGMLAMANYGANTNGSQFFINLKANSALDKKFTVIGELIEGWDVLKKIARTSTTGSGRPVHPVIIKGIEISK